ncbi:MAG: hypothetical protein COC15_00795 [Legionellales bacterium]|nr:MAG: hypothetical protein COC15_00795 [Legionellales bacterium]
MQQYLTSKKSLYHSHLILLLAIALWYFPYSQQIWLAVDGAIFNILNGSLVDAPKAQFFWGMLNHKREVWLNMVAALGISSYAIYANAPGTRLKLLLRITYFIIFLEVALWIQNYIVDDVLLIMRHSPSLELKPHVMLSKVLNNPLIKDSSGTQSCLPAGHAFALLYWAGFTWICCKRNIGYVALALALFLCLPRLFSGAHWFSDVVVTGVLAWIWVSWGCQLYKLATQLIIPKRSSL